MAASAAIKANSFTRIRFILSILAECHVVSEIQQKAATRPPTPYAARLEPYWLAADTPP
jgi:hypothetical protein